MRNNLLNRSGLPLVPDGPAWPRVAGAEVPVLDEHGLLRVPGRWVALSPLECRLVSVLLDRYDSVVGRAELWEAGWSGVDAHPTSLRTAVVRLRRRIAALGLEIRTVRARGYALVAGPSPLL